MKISKEQIQELLLKSDAAVARALVLLNERQTITEQNSQSTLMHNARGFRPCHARMGTSMATFYLRFGKLTPKQIAYWRKPMNDGNPRICIYWKQLQEEAEKKSNSVIA